MTNNATKRRKRMEIDRLMTRPTRKSPSAKGADVVFGIPVILGLQKRGACCRSIEHRRDLLDVDAFLGHTQIVIGDGNDDRATANQSGEPQQPGDGVQYRTREGP